MIKFPYSRPSVNARDIVQVTKALKSQFLTGGKVIREFEKQISDEFNVTHSIVCNSGTAALHLVYSSLGLGPDNSLLTTPMTFVATANAARMCNSKVYFSDVDPNTGLLTPELLEKELKKKYLKIKVITIVHLGGRVCDLEGIYRLAKKYNCYLVEDACHAPGAVYSDSKGRLSLIGSCKFSTASCFSFHAIKHITMAEGGCVTTNSKMLSNKVRNKLNHSMLKAGAKFKKKGKFADPWFYQIKELGWNYRASEINCALGMSQIRRLKNNVKERKKIASFYLNELKRSEYITFPKDAFVKNANAWHLFSVFINFKKIRINKRSIMNALAKKGIGTQVHYIPIILQPYYKGSNKYKFPGTLEYYEKNLSLPMYSTLTKNNVRYISNALKTLLRSNGRT